MAELHEALTALGPVAWNDVPQDSLPNFLTESFAAGELICNSLPALLNGTPFHEATPFHDTPNTANSSSEIHVSSARAHPSHESHEILQKNWGKPVSIKAKDNPLNASVYKMAGHDRHGAWFARKSVHEGLGFDKFRRAMQREFAHSMTISGGPGAGAVRGLAADRRLEKMVVQGKGRLDVYELSAQFPGPVTPRDFLAMVMTTEDALGEKSATHTESGGTHVPRHFMIVSRPVDHPDAPLRAGFVRGQYESVEMIREIPLHLNKATSTPDTMATHGSGGESGSTANVELNPVEWIMITRSDPGGGIPRFLVDRGTPDSMLGDLKKFFDWACGMDQVPEPDADIEKQEDTSKHEEAERQQVGLDTVNGTSTSEQQARGELSSTTALPAGQTGQSGGGLLSGIGNTLQAGIQAIAPTAVTNYLHPDEKGAEYDSSDSETSSSDSFMSADEDHQKATAPGATLVAPRASNSLDDLSLASSSSEMKDKKDMNHHEKEIHKLVQKRESLDRRLARKRAEAEDKLQKSREKDETDVERAQEKLEKEMQKTEDKHKKEIEKLERKKEKEARKAEERRRKKDDANVLSRVSRERDEFRSQTELVKKENVLLTSQIEELQKEVMVLTQRRTDASQGVQALPGVVSQPAHNGTDGAT